MATERQTPGVDQSILISAAPVRVLDAFFEPEALARWWQTVRSITTPRPLGVYAVEWDATPDTDDVLGRLGGVFYGVIAEYRPGRELFVADAWWLPPDGDPVGPMSLQVTCVMEGQSCRLRVRQTGYDESPRWQRYYGLIDRGWQSSLATLKAYLEAEFSPGAAR